MDSLIKMTYSNHAIIFFSFKVFLAITIFYHSFFVDYNRNHLHLSIFYEKISPNVTENAFYLPGATFICLHLYFFKNSVCILKYLVQCGSTPLNGERESNVIADIRVKKKLH